MFKRNVNLYERTTENLDAAQTKHELRYNIRISAYESANNSKHAYVASPDVQLSVGPRAICG